MQRLQGQHTAENLSSVVLAVIQDYGLQQRIGYFMLDNATVNDKCVDLLCQNLLNNYSPSAAKECRLRCSGHVLNLVMKSFLFGTDIEAFEQDAQASFEAGDETHEVSLWRRKGPISKLHNLITYIRQSPQRMEEFLQIQVSGDSETAHGLQVIADNATRWSSTHAMIQRAMKCRDCLDLFASRQPHKRLAADRLSNDDWEQLTHILVLLQPFEHLTKLL